MNTDKIDTKIRNNANKHKHAINQARTDSRSVVWVAEAGDT